MSADAGGAVRRPVGALVVPVCLLLAACTSAVGAPAQSAGSSPTPDAASASTAWVDRCTSQVSYWVKAKLAGDDGNDYQEMGLSSAAYEAFRDVITQSRDRPQTAEWIKQHSRTACTAHAAEGLSPNEEGWP